MLSIRWILAAKSKAYQQSTSVYISIRTQLISRNYNKRKNFLLGRAFLTYLDN